jgi:hypothetical protein
MWHIACIYLVILLYLGVPLEGKLVDTLLAILGGVYFIISWSFGMVKTLIRHYLIGFVLLEISHYISCVALHLLGNLHIHSWSWFPWDSHILIRCMHLVDHFLFLEVGYETFS